MSGLTEPGVKVTDTRIKVFPRTLIEWEIDAQKPPPILAGVDRLMMLGGLNSEGTFRVSHRTLWLKRVGIMGCYELCACKMS